MLQNISFYGFTKVFAIYIKVNSRNTTESFTRLMCFILYLYSISINNFNRAFVLKPCKHMTNTCVKLVHRMVYEKLQVCRLIFLSRFKTVFFIYKSPTTSSSDINRIVVGSRFFSASYLPCRSNRYLDKL